MTQLTMRRLVAGVALALAAILAVGLAARAQDQTGCEMSGYVLDPQGRGVPRAEVELKISGRSGSNFTRTELDGSYVVQIPAPILQEAGYLYTILRGNDTLITVGQANFKRCRTRRDIFTNDPRPVDRLPGPTPPAPPPVLPAYPAPDAPADGLEGAVAFFDLTALPRGGVVPGDSFKIPICVASFTSRAPQVSALTFVGEFDPTQLRVASDAIRTVRVTPNQQVREASISYQTTGGRQRGRILFSVDFNGLVSLPILPTPCTSVAEVEMQALAWNGATGLRPGDTVGLSNVKDTVRGINPTMRLGGVDGPIARATTYLDVLTPQEQQDILKRAWLPLLIRNDRARTAP